MNGDRRVLVTGGCGFIGSNFIRHVLKKYPDYKIVNLDKLTYAGNLDNLKDVEKNPNYSFVKGDICDPEIVETVTKDIDYVVHFAAESHVDRSIIDAGVFVKTDVIGTYVLLEKARKHNIKRFVCISTDEVYGSIEKGSFKETNPLNPSNPYSASKAGAELIARSYYTTYNLPIIVTRSSNNFGPYQYPEKLIPVLIINALQNKSLPIYGDGKNVRDWLYVLDNCKAIDLVLHKGDVGGVYNIGGSNEKTNIEIANMILKTLEKNKDLIKFVKDRSGHDRRYSLDSTKIKKLGWKPESSFEKQIEETVKWYKDNERWWAGTRQ